MSLPRLYEKDDHISLYTDYATLVGCGIGIIGCAISMKVNLASMKNLSSSIFMMVFGISDAIILIIRFMESISNVTHAHALTNTNSFDLLYGQSNWRCRFGVFITTVSKIVSSWLICAMVAEFSIPKQCLSVARAGQVSLISTLLAIAASFPFIVMAEPNKDTNYNNMYNFDHQSHNIQCTSSYRLFFDFYLRVIIELIVTLAVPILLTIGCLLKLTIDLYKFINDGGGGASLTNSNSWKTYREDPESTMNCVRLAMWLGWTQIIFAIPFVVTSSIDEINRFENRQTNNLIGGDWLDKTHRICRLIAILPLITRFYMAVFASKKLARFLNRICKCGRMPDEDDKRFQHDPHSGQIAENSGYATRSHIYKNDYNSPKFVMSQLDTSWI